MNTSPTLGKMMLVNCSVNQTFNFVYPIMNTPVMLVMMCSRCHFIQPLPQGTKSITCDVCKFITFLDHDPHSRLPWQHSPKRAVICGISYRKSSHELKGSIHAAMSMKELLIKSFDFSESDIVMLTDHNGGDVGEDQNPSQKVLISNFESESGLSWESCIVYSFYLEEETNPFKTPTKNNLLWALNWLGQGCRSNDSLVFHYSGHGSRLRNYRLTDDDDGYNETLCPMDFKTQGMIFDDEINRAIVERLPPEVKLHAIIDSCHRNSVLELSFLYKKNRSTGQYEWEDHGPRSGVFKGTSGGDAISFSGSVEVPPSADDAEPLLSACGKFDVNSKLFTL